MRKMLYENICIIMEVRIELFIEQNECIKSDSDKRQRIELLSYEEIEKLI